MNFEQVLQLIQEVSSSNLNAFHYKNEQVEICMKAKKTIPSLSGMSGESVKAVASPTQAEEEGKLTVQLEKAQEGKIIHSPLVGTFYCAASEDSEAFVKVGDHVKKGQVLAIVEAMKLMNEIESEYDGIITEILVENATGIAYGQPLFIIE